MCEFKVGDVVQFSEATPNLWVRHKIAKIINIGHTIITFQDIKSGGHYFGANFDNLEPYDLKSFVRKAVYEQSIQSNI